MNKYVDPYKPCLGTYQMDGWMDGMDGLMISFSSVMSYVQPTHTI